MTSQDTPNKGPIINLVDDEKAKSISWEVSDVVDEVQEVKDLIQDGFDGDKKPKDDLVPLEEVEQETVYPESDDKEEIHDDEDKEEEEKKRSHKVPRTKRISELVREKKGYKALAEDTIIQKKQLEQEVEYLRGEVLRKEKEKLESYDQSLKANIDNIKRTLTIAKEEGDYKTETEATDLLSQYNAEKMRVMQERERYNHLPNVQYQQQYQPIHKQQQSHAQDNNVFDEDASAYKESAMNWLKNNSWADPHSSNFDRDLHEEAADYEVRLAKAYKLQGKSDEIGSEQFWNQISDHVVEEFDLPIPKKQPPKQERLVMNGPNTPVTPVTRNNITPNAPAKNKNIPLTPQEKQFAHKLYGKIREPNGKVITDLKKCEEYYMKHKMAGN